MQPTDTESRSPRESSDTFCPFIKSPRPECYCVDMNNHKINLAMRFCMRNYKACRIFEKISLQKGIGATDSKAPRKTI